MRAIEDAAGQISKRVVGDADEFQFDPMFIAALIQIILAAVAAVKQCREENELVNYTRNLCQRGRRGHVLAQWRLQRIVREQLGYDSEPSLVRDVARELMHVAATDPPTLEAVILDTIEGD